MVPTSTGKGVCIYVILNLKYISSIFNLIIVFYYVCGR